MRRIWVDPTIVQEALSSKEALEALALCCMVKLTFVDSMVKGATVRRMMSVFHLSYGRCVKAIEVGISRGYFVKDGENLRAAKIRSINQHCVALELPAPQSKDDCPITITHMCDALRGAVLYNHIAKQNDLRDTLQLARDPKPGEIQQMKRAKARLRRKGVCAENSVEGLRLSYDRIASMLNICKTKAKATVKRLIDQGLIKRVLQYEEVDVELEKFSKDFQKNYAKYGSRGFLILCGGHVFVQLANAYSLCGDSLVKFLV